MALTFDTLHDPHMMQDSLAIDGVTGFVETNSLRSFHLDYSQYIELIRASYETSCTLDMEFGKYLSFGVFQYYCVILLWLRLYVILSKRGINTGDLSAIREILNFHLVAPLDIAAYLEGIGDLKDFTGREYQIGIQGSLVNLNINDAQGSYGKINEYNMIIYETLPSPLISLLKIRADMLFDETDSVWQLPDKLDPDFESPSRPTRNLLGWWPAETLTIKQKIMLVISGITPNAFNVINIAHLPINAMLMRQVANKLDSSTEKMSRLPLSRYGSFSQIPFTSRAMEDTQADSSKSIAGKLGSTNSYIPMPKNIVSASAIFRYRIKRYEKGTDDMLAYYDYDDKYRLSRILLRENLVFEFGVGGEFWNRSDFRLSPQNGQSLVKDFARRIKIRYQFKPTEYFDLLHDIYTTTNISTKDTTISTNYYLD